ncbi:hypothetical protein ACWO0M_001329 [Vibrio parahaemolyticus]|uniref:hypothetical protein n=1 Tax=Vibrio parahaemolyticus TaxID=670 RepID=UPI0007DC0631|nr:hypothetical protein [Vibrio parahaemolyticus]EGR1758000.1 hypothetical protein [Vibrio parahaemolyticus]EHU5176017.1 hypothetical protein [Vibrio parahaemolyticus]EHV5548517.1 hypothetical protein [Vibrio parahaemolyticus]ELB2095435.1 hypothetical protein [Vibrio parahaemolyticus]ELB2127425.1 hypothetical protein [Vibrio parahaemolyticus]
MKPRGTNNAAENELTTPKSAFGKPISQCGLSTKSLKLRRTYQTRENVISASKSAFVPTNSTSRVSAKNSTQLTQKSPHQRTNQPLKRYQFGIFTTPANTEIESQYDSLNFEFLPLNLAI